uniref:DUF1985 domain-containing protein n=1 Tax=Cannabis sativa TaxID=3483 RepID=A0A803QC31_CANSA
MDKTPDTIVCDIIPNVDPGVQQQDYPQSDSVSKNLNDQVESGNVAFVDADSGTGSEVPVYASKKREVKKSRAKKKVKVDPSDDDFVEHIESGTSSKVSARVVHSDVPNLPVRRTIRAGVKCLALKGPSPSIPEASIKKFTSFSNVMGNIKWNIALPHLALVREVHQGREDLEKWFLIRDRVVRFGLEEFVLITGLSLKGSSDLNEFKQKMSFKKKIFPDLTIKVIQEQVRARFLSGEFDDDVDAVKMAIVFLLSHYLYGYENGKRVDNELFGFVDGDLSELRNIAFGKLLWDRTFHYMNLAFKDGDNTIIKLRRPKKKRISSILLNFKGFHLLSSFGCSRYSQACLLTTARGLRIHILEC